jgi:AraC-like DNA-binding protein
MPLADLVRHDSSLGRWEFARWQPPAALQCYIEDLWHMRSEGSYTRERPSLVQRFGLLERYLLSRAASGRQPRAEVGYALGRVARTRGGVRMRALAAETGISQKHLIHLFREEVGMAPKRYARIVRLNAVLRQMSSSTWADLAAEFGYYDQAHFVRDFREFSGTTPTGFLRARGPDGDSVVLGD